MAPGLGLLRQVVVDQHFAERGRIGRLLGAVARNPRNTGIGIDEDTAIVVRDHRRIRVIGKGAVYIVDGSPVSYSNLTEEAPDRTLSMFDVKLHILSMGDGYDLRTRTPVAGSAVEVEEALVGSAEE
jgi:cyanophycinase